MLSSCVVKMTHNAWCSGLFQRSRFKVSLITYKELGFSLMTYKEIKPDHDGAEGEKGEGRGRLRGRGGGGGGAGSCEHGALGPPVACHEQK